MGKKFDAFTRGTKALFKAVGQGLSEGARIYEETHPVEPPVPLQVDVTLGVEALKNLQGMNCFQLEKLFKGKRVHLADDPNVYRELKRFNCFQLEAIFGKEEG